MGVGFVGRNRVDLPADTNCEIRRAVRWRRRVDAWDGGCRSRVQAVSARGDVGKSKATTSLFFETIKQPFPPDGSCAACAAPPWEPEVPYAGTLPQGFAQFGRGSSFWTPEEEVGCAWVGRAVGGSAVVVTVDPRGAFSLWALCGIMPNASIGRDIGRWASCGA